MEPSKIYSGHGHNFDVGIAYHLGLNAAVVFNHIVYWIRFNALKHENSYIDGKYWMYETQEAISNSLGYLTLEQVKKAVVDLVDHGLLIKGNYNKNKFDRTAWYTVHNQEIITLGLRNSKNSFESAKNNNGERRIQESNIESGALYNIDTGKETYKKQQQKVAEPAQSYDCDSAVVVSSKNEKNQQYDKTVQPKIHKCLEKVDIPEEERIWITKHYDENTVKNAIQWSELTKDKIKTSYIAYLKMACQRGLSVRDLPKAKIGVFEELKLHFKNGEIYNGATCILSSQLIAFERTMRNEHIEINQFFCWKKFKSLCDGFGIIFERAKT